MKPLLKSLLNSIGRALFSLGVIAAAVAGVALMGRPERRQIDRQPPQAKVEVTAAAAHRGAFEFTVDGVVVPFREVNVAAEVSGRVVYKSPLCRAGGVVREGDLLFRIDPTDYDLEIERLNNEIELARKELAIRVGELERFEQAPDQGVFSKAEIDAAKRAELMARSAWRSRTDQLKRARLDKMRCEVRARIGGSIIRESVQQEGFVQKGGVLLTIRDTSKMEVRCNLRMRQMQWLWESYRSQLASGAATPGDLDVAGTPDGIDRETPVAQLYPAAPGRAGYSFPPAPADVIYELGGAQYKWRGRLVRYADSSVDDRTRMIPCVAEVTEPENSQLVAADDPDQVAGDTAGLPVAPPALLSGMFVTLRIRVDLPRQLIQLPVTAVGPGGDAWIVAEDEKLHRVRVEVVHADREHVLLEAGRQLPPGARVVTSPLVNPIEGYPAEVVDTTRDGGQDAEDAGGPAEAAGPTAESRS